MEEGERVRFIAVFDREADGRWIAEVPELPGVLVYGRDRDEAFLKLEALALRVIAERIEHGESVPGWEPGKRLEFSLEAAAA